MLYFVVFIFGVIVGVFVFAVLVGKNLRTMREQLEFEEEIRLKWDQPPD
jgi:hypothetical protein